MPGPYQASSCARVLSAISVSPAVTLMRRGDGSTCGGGSSILHSARSDMVPHSTHPGAPCPVVVRRTVATSLFALTRIYVFRHIRVVSEQAFGVLADGTRRRILDELRRDERSVGGLAETLQVGQPTMSKHLKVLRDAGFVSCRVAAQRRIYRLESQPLEAIDAWLRPYRELWTRHLDALERHLDRQDDHQEDT